MEDIGIALFWKMRYCVAVTYDLGYGTQTLSFETWTECVGETCRHTLYYPASTRPLQHLRSLQISSKVLWVYRIPNLNPHTWLALGARGGARISDLGANRLMLGARKNLQSIFRWSQYSNLQVCPHDKWWYFKHHNGFLDTFVYVKINVALKQTLASAWLLRNCNDYLFHTWSFPWGFGLNWWWFHALI